MGKFCNLFTSFETFISNMQQIHASAVSVKPLALGSLVLAVAAAAAWTRAVTRSHSLHLSAALTDVQLPHAASGKP